MLVKTNFNTLLYFICFTVLSSCDKGDKQQSLPAQSGNFSKEEQQDEYNILPSNTTQQNQQLINSLQEQPMQLFAQALGNNMAISPESPKIINPESNDNNLAPTTSRPITHKEQTTLTVKSSQTTNAIQPNKTISEQTSAIKWANIHPQAIHYQISDTKPEQTEQQSKALLMEAISLKLKSGNDPDLLQKAIDKFLQAAQSPSTATSAMYHLGNICEDHQAWKIAMQWYTLAFQYSWMQDPNKAYQSASYEKIATLVKNKKDVYLPLQSINLAHPKAIPTPDKKIAAYLTLIDAYTKNKFESYLGKTAREHKIKGLKLALDAYAEQYPEPYKKTVSWWKKAKENLKSGNYKDASECLHKISYHPLALYQLGKLHEKGYLSKAGIPNYKKAVSYYQRSATMKAYEKLAILYQQAKVDGTYNYDKSKGYWELANTPVAWEALGFMYKQGITDEGVNYKKAQYYWELANTPGSLYNLGHMYIKGLVHGEPNLEKAQYYFELSQTPHALHNLGIMHYKGLIDGNPNYQQAEYYWKLANKSDSWQNLVALYYDGLIDGIPDYKKAQYYWELADTEDAWNSLALLHYEGKINGKPNYMQAALYWEKVTTTKAFYNLGHLHYNQLLGKKSSYQQAKIYFEKADMQEAHECLGELYYKGYLNGRPDYLKAEYHWKIANTPQTRYKIGEMYYDGLIGGKPDYQKAQHYWKLAQTSDAFHNLGVMHLDGLVDDIPDFAQAQSCFEASQKKESFHNLGLMHLEGKITGQPDYIKAQECFEQAQTPEALHNLGSMYVKGYIGVTETQDGQKLLDYQKAFECFSRSNTKHSKVGLLKLYEYDIIQPPANETKAQVTQKLLQEISIALPHLLTSEDYMMKALLDLYLDNSTSALVYLQQALAYGSQYSHELEAIVEEIADDFLDEVDSEQETLTSDLTTHESFKAQTTEEIFSNQKQQTELTQEEAISTHIAREQKTRKHNKAEKKIRKTKQIRERILDSLSNVRMHEQRKRKFDPASITFVFLNEKAKVAFELFQENNKKVNELLADIRYYQAEPKGIGKPEILSYRFRGYKGCISRRINQEVRIIYKAFDKTIGPGKILILDWEGHYS